jgi:hypothetical protein
LNLNLDLDLNVNSFGSLWYYLAGSVFLYAYDKVVRLTRAGTANACVRARFHSLADRPPDPGRPGRASGVTHLVLRTPARGFRHYEAGSYAWINVPAISPAEWHPFTISSCAPCDGVPGMVDVNFHVKAEGRWTMQVCEPLALVVVACAGLSLSLITLSLSLTHSLRLSLRSLLLARSLSLSLSP